MRREELFHIARAAAAVAGVRRVLIVGSQAVLGSYSDAELPYEVVHSIEADVVILDDIVGDGHNVVEGALGYMSAFHTSNGYYAEGIEVGTAIFPKGWESRAPCSRSVRAGSPTSCRRVSASAFR